MSSTYHRDRYLANRADRIAASLANTARLKSLGLCVSCGKNPKGATQRCDECRQRNLIRTRALYQSNDGAAYQRKRLYGITKEQFQLLSDKQEGKCAICRNPNRKLHLDHDHQDGRIRGLLCGPCNRSIGVLGDSIESLMRVVTYLSGVN